MVKCTDMYRTLILLPSELLLKIFLELPSFNDVFALAAACTSLRGLWLISVPSIYKQIAPRNIMRERYARKLLADQKRSSSILAPQTPADVFQLLKNAKVVEAAIAQFEREVVWRIKCWSTSCHSGQYSCD